VITGAFFVAGIINSGNISSYFSIGFFYFIYISLRFLLVVIIYIIMRVKKREIASRRIIEKIIIIINVVINIIAFCVAVFGGFNGFVIFFLLLIGMIILTIISSGYSCKTLYFILDTLVIVFFLIVGTIDSWGLNSYFKITGWGGLYILPRSIILLVIFIYKKLYFKTIEFNTRKTFLKLLICFNAALNIIFISLFVWQIIGASGV
jgi:hypothetical protein